MNARECPKCEVCNGSSHHWIPDPLATDDPEFQSGDHACKHCDVRGDCCEACDGMGCQTESDDDAWTCPVCAGEGVIALSSDPLDVAARRIVDLWEDWEREAYQASQQSQSGTVYIDTMQRHVRDTIAAQAAALFGGQDAPAGAGEQPRIDPSWLRARIKLEVDTALSCRAVDDADEIARLTTALRDAEQRSPTEEFCCKARPTADPPQECDFPLCGCSRVADEAVESLIETGWLNDREAGELRRQLRDAEQRAAGVLELAKLAIKLDTELCHVRHELRTADRLSVQMPEWRDGLLRSITGNDFEEQEKVAVLSKAMSITRTPTAPAAQASGEGE